MPCAVRLFVRYPGSSNLPIHLYTDTRLSLTLYFFIHLFISTYLLPLIHVNYYHSFNRTCFCQDLRPAKHPLLVLWSQCMPGFAFILKSIMLACSSHYRHDLTQSFLYVFCVLTSASGMLDPVTVIPFSDFYNLKMLSPHPFARVQLSLSHLPWFQCALVVAPDPYRTRQVADFGSKKPSPSDRIKLLTVPTQNHAESPNLK